MRTFALAIFLFAIGFGTISVSQNASATIGQNQIVLKLRDWAATVNSAPSASPDTARDKTFADYLAAADQAFADLEKSCSDADRARLGLAFADLVGATKDVHAGKIEPGPLSAATAQAGSSQALDHLRIYSQIINASRRGVLQGRHFPPGAARLMFVQMKTTGNGDADLPELAGFQTTRCAPH